MARRGSAWGSRGWVIPPGEGEPVDLGGPHRPEILVRGADVFGALGAFVLQHDVITENPPHAHHGFMKITFVLDGTYYFRVGDAEFSAGPGATVVVPRGSYHTFVTATACSLSVRLLATRNCFWSLAGWGRTRARNG
jgi:mannose-6-phosphate isomerase-like protein (cupin superfamily)